MEILFFDFIEWGSYRAKTFCVKEVYLMEGKAADIMKEHQMPLPTGS